MISVDGFDVLEEDDKNRVMKAIGKPSEKAY
jgi:hypothetical protein